jgi:hypothetical protein
VLPCTYLIAFVGLFRKDRSLAAHGIYPHLRYIFFLNIFPNFAGRTVLYKFCHLAICLLVRNSKNWFITKQLHSGKCVWVIDSFFPSRQSVSVVSVKEVVLMKNSSGVGQC